MDALDEFERYDVWSTETVRSITSRSLAASVPNESFLLAGFDLSFCRMPLGGCVSAELEGDVGGIGGMESTLAVRSESGKDVGFGG